MSFRPQQVNGQSVTNYKDKLLYSSAVIGSAQDTEAVIFDYKRGKKPGGDNNEDITSDYRHANGTDGGNMNERDWMDVVSIAVEFPTDVAVTPIQQCMDRLYLKIFSGGDHELFGGLARHFPAGTGLLAETTQTAKEYLNNGALGANQRLKLSVPIRLEPGQPYRAELWNQGGALATAAVDTIVRVMYRGPGASGV
ncbi:MAG: hypothetical protein ABFR47_09740, partial [Verrucomicrobiota bacterium]